MFEDLHRLSPLLVVRLFLSLTAYSPWRIWDVGFFLCFLAARVAGNLKNQVRQIFLESYQAERPLNLAAVEQMSQEWAEYLPLMQVILDIRQFTPEELFEELLNPC